MLMLCLRLCLFVQVCVNGHIRFFVLDNWAVCIWVSAARVSLGDWIAVWIVYWMCRNVKRVCVDVLMLDLRPCVAVAVCRHVGGCECF